MTPDNLAPLRQAVREARGNFSGWFDVDEWLAALHAHDKYTAAVRALAIAERNAEPIMDDPTHPETWCEDCGGPNIGWFAPNSVWNRVMRLNPAAEDLVCPLCFVRRAKAIGLDTTWLLRPGGEDEMTAENTRLQSEIYRLREQVRVLEATRV